MNATQLAQLAAIERHFPPPELAAGETLKMEVRPEGIVLVGLPDGSILAAHEDGRGAWRYTLPAASARFAPAELWRERKVVKRRRLPVMDVPGPPSEPGRN